jgi:hypothetical protein
VEVGSLSAAIAWPPAASTIEIAYAIFLLYPKSVSLMLFCSNYGYRAKQATLLAAFQPIP